MTTPVFSLASVVLAVAALHAVGLTVVLAVRSRRAHARTVLVVLSGVLALLLVDMTLRFSGIALPSPVLRALVGAFWFAVPPLFYEYVRALMRLRTRAEPTDLAHAVPFATQVLLIVTWPLVGDPEGQRMAWVSFFTIYVVQAVAYGGAVGMLVLRYVRRYRHEGAGADDDRLYRLRLYGGGFAAYAVATLVNYIAYLATGTVFAWLDYLVPLALAALVASVAYERLRASLVTLPRLALPDPRSVGAEPERTATPRPAGDLQRHANTLRRLMEDDRLYLDPTLRLADLADRLSIGERACTDVLAQAFGATFYDLVNGYRVDEAQARLRDPATAHLTVLAVGLDAGFSSKASFNRVFKARTGETPSAYRRRMAVEPGRVSGDGRSGARVRGDSVRGDSVRGDSVRGDSVRGDSVGGVRVGGEGARSDGLLGDGMSGDGGADPPAVTASHRAG
ncbi:MAG: helix-turn-helix transcriptional regulator [Bacteroidota bacterium]